MNKLQPFICEDDLKSSVKYLLRLHGAANKIPCKLRTLFDLSTTTLCRLMHVLPFLD
jgi:hypothetical protein